MYGRLAKRSGWIAVWALWAFVGWRLYVDLPRFIDPPVVVLQLEDEEEILGFFGDEDAVVTLYTKDAPFVRVWDAATGAVRNKWSIGCVEGEKRGATWFSSRQGVLLMPHGHSAASQRPELMDLRTGKSRPLACTFAASFQANLDTHHEKPWCCVVAQLPGDPPPTLQNQ
jgi:hypothetical protein